MRLLPSHAVECHNVACGPFGERREATRHPDRLITDSGENAGRSGVVQPLCQFRWEDFGQIRKRAAVRSLRRSKSRMVLASNWKVGS